jgi:hypothetical protein
MAFLHARGLTVEPDSLDSAVRSAVREMQALYRAQPGEEGLTAAEIAVARSGGLVPEPRPGSREPLLAGVVLYASLIETGLTTRQAGERLGVSDARIRQRLRDRSLFGVRHGRSWKLPLFQFTAHGELPGWGAVCARLPLAVAPVAVERWLALPHSDLVVREDEPPVSPRAWLLHGRSAEAVAELADELS